MDICLDLNLWIIFWVSSQNFNCSSCWALTLGVCICANWKKTLILLTMRYHFAVHLNTCSISWLVALRYRSTLDEYFDYSLISSRLYQALMMTQSLSGISSMQKQKKKTRHNLTEHILMSLDEQVDILQFQSSLVRQTIEVQTFL